MGWCSGTIVFDAVCDALLSDNKDTEYAIKALIEALHDGDWDCEPDSEYFEHPVVKKCFIDMGYDYFYEED